MEIPRHWRLRKQRYAMEGVICPDCASHIFPPREVCPVCHGEGRQEVTHIEREVYLFSTVQELRPVAGD